MMEQSNIFSDWNKFPEEGATFLIGIDESQSYEIDITEIWKHEDKLILITASGCSCWSGEYERRDFNSIDELVAHFNSVDLDTYVYNPSPKGILTLLRELERIK